jgi:uncharacterized repeat protein (TIGR04076 family)
LINLFWKVNKRSEFKEHKIKLVVKSSKCELYKAGDEIYIDGTLLNKEKSDNVCLTAINAFYPFIYAARKRVTADQMGFSELTFQCPDCPERVEFTIVQYEE